MGSKSRRDKGVFAHPSKEGRFRAPLKIAPCCRHLGVLPAKLVPAEAREGGNPAISDISGFRLSVEPVLGSANGRTQGAATGMTILMNSVLALRQGRPDLRPISLS